MEEARAALAAEHHKELLRVQGECSERIEAAARCRFVACFNLCVDVCGL